MKKSLIILIMLVFLFIAGCAPDGVSVGAMYLNTNLGPYSINEVVPMVGFNWDLRSPPTNSALTKRAVSSDSGDLSK